MGLGTVIWLGMFRFECELFGYNGVTAWQGYKSIYYRAINCSNILILEYRYQKLQYQLKFQLIELFIFNITMCLEAFSCIDQCNRHQYFLLQKFLRFGCFALKWWLFEQVNWQNCQSYFHSFFLREFREFFGWKSKHLKFHINLYSNMPRLQFIWTQCVIP